MVNYGSLMFLRVPHSSLGFLIVPQDFPGFLKVSKVLEVSCLSSSQEPSQCLFPFTSQLVILLWSTVASARRIMAIVVFFIPSLGLFNILNHWKAEQIPFYIRSFDMYKYMSPSDIIELNNMTRNITWTSIDRWEYSSTGSHQPPHYSLYTGRSLGQTFVAFLVLMALQIISISVVKITTAKKAEKKKRTHWFNFMVHILENLNIPFPQQDWDTDNLIVAEYKQRVREVNLEMAWTYVVNCTFNILMFCPFWWTGNFLIHKLII